MISYQRTNWVDGQNKYSIKDQSDNVIHSDIKLVYTGNGGTPISSTNMNKIEQGLEDSTSNLINLSKKTRCGGL